MARAGPCSVHRRWEGTCSQMDVLPKPLADVSRGVPDWAAFSRDLTLIPKGKEAFMGV